MSYSSFKVFICQRLKFDIMSVFLPRKIGDATVGALGYGLIWGVYDPKSLASSTDEERFAVCMTTVVLRLPY